MPDSMENQIPIPDPDNIQLLPNQEDESSDASDPKVTTADVPTKEQSLQYEDNKKLMDGNKKLSSSGRIT